MSSVETSVFTVGEFGGRTSLVGAAARATLLVVLTVTAESRVVVAEVTATNSVVESRRSCGRLERRAEAISL